MSQGDRSYLPSPLLHGELEGGKGGRRREGGKGKNNFVRKDALKATSLTRSKHHVILNSNNVLWARICISLSSRGALNYSIKCSYSAPSAVCKLGQVQNKKRWVICVFL